jgi:hypothetical protein
MVQAQDARLDTPMTNQLPPIAVGQEIWLRQVNGHYGPSGDPMDFTVVGETKTLWKVKRSSWAESPVMPIRKDMSDWGGQLSANDARKLLWVRAHCRKIAEVARSTINSAFDKPEKFEFLKQIAELIGYKDNS